MQPRGELVEKVEHAGVRPVQVLEDETLFLAARRIVEQLAALQPTLLACQTGTGVDFPLAVTGSPGSYSMAERVLR